MDHFTDPNFSDPPLFLCLSTMPRQVGEVRLLTRPRLAPRQLQLLRAWLQWICAVHSAIGARGGACLGVAAAEAIHRARGIGAHGDQQYSATVHAAVRSSNSFASLRTPIPVTFPCSLMPNAAVALGAERCACVCSTCTLCPSRHAVGVTSPICHARATPWHIFLRWA